MMDMNNFLQIVAIVIELLGLIFQIYVYKKK